MANWNELKNMFDPKHSEAIQKAKVIDTKGQHKMERHQHHSNNQNDKRGH